MFLVLSEFIVTMHTNANNMPFRIYTQRLEKFDHKYSSHTDSSENWGPNTTSWTSVVKVSVALKFKYFDAEGFTGTGHYIEWRYNDQNFQECIFFHSISLTLRSTYSYLQPRWRTTCHENQRNRHISKGQLLCRNLTVFHIGKGKK